MTTVKTIHFIAIIRVSFVSNHPNPLNPEEDSWQSKEISFLKYLPLYPDMDHLRVIPPPIPTINIRESEQLTVGEG